MDRRRVEVGGWREMSGRVVDNERGEKDKVYGRVEATAGKDAAVVR